MPELETTQKQSVKHWDLEDDAAYQAWRADKLARVKKVLDLAPVRLSSLAKPSESETKELRQRCQISNLAIYESGNNGADPAEIRRELLAFSDHMGLFIAERHRSAGDYGIVALTPSDAPRQRGYIPYSQRAMNWHTDGYYNAPDQQILAMVLHCVRPADDGGVNQLMDPEIAYIRLRDENPDYIAALMAPEAMTIPENREPDGSVRPTSTGPVFFFDAAGHLAMRYTARSRSIAWRQDARTQQATRVLLDILHSDDPMILTTRMTAGQGVLCNNVLHNRTGFDPDKTDSSRLLFRIRFHNRIN